jgi:hypothetical protein
MDEIIRHAKATGFYDDMRVALSVCSDVPRLVDHIPDVLTGNTELIETFCDYADLDCRGCELLLCKYLTIDNLPLLQERGLNTIWGDCLPYLLTCGNYDTFQYLVRTTKNSLDQVYRPAGGRKCFTIMGLCCSMGYIEGLELLLAHGADPTICCINDQGELLSLLMLAYDQPHQPDPQLIKTLLKPEMKQRLDFANTRGHSVRHIAIKRGHSLLTSL